MRAPGHSCPLLPRTSCGTAGWTWGGKPYATQTTALLQKKVKIKNFISAYVSRQTGAMMEQRKVCAWGWQPVCSRGLQSSERGTTSFSRLLCPKKFGSRISEYPTSLQTLIWLGMGTQRVDWLMSNANNWVVMATRAAVKNKAMLTSLPSPKSAQGWGMFTVAVSAVLRIQVSLYRARWASPHQSTSLLSTTYQRDDVLGDSNLFVISADRKGAVSRWWVWAGGGKGNHTPHSMKKDQQHNLLYSLAKAKIDSQTNFVLKNLIHTEQPKESQILRITENLFLYTEDNFEHFWDNPPLQAWCLHTSLLCNCRV